MSTLLVAHVGADTIGVGVALALGAALLVVGGSRRHARRLLVAVAAGGLLLQVVHLTEHLVQAAHWVAAPAAAPWLGPWAKVGAASLGGLADGQLSTGGELLHLLGNAGFLAGVVAATALARGQGCTIRRPLHAAGWVQGAHVVEHVLLTATWVGWGHAAGLSTGFGLLVPGSATAVAVRVWFHLLVNLVATVLVARGLVAWRRAGMTTTDTATVEPVPVGRTWDGEPALSSARR